MYFLYYIILYCIVLYCIVLCCVVLCCVVLCCVVLCCVVLHYITTKLNNVDIVLFLNNNLNICLYVFEQNSLEHVLVVCK